MSMCGGGGPKVNKFEEFHEDRGPKCGKGCPKVKKFEKVWGVPM